MTEQVTGAAKPVRSGRRWFVRLAIWLGVLLVLGGGFLGFAEYRTAQPDFCGSCHIMEPYHESWQADLHGSKLGVACVECHYAPGERTTVKAKLRGLSQVASYVSGRYGSTRPRAHVNNDSCLMAKCHGDGKFLEKDLQIGTVRFSHAKHFQRSSHDLQPLLDDLEEMNGKLRQSLDPETFAKLESVAREAGSHKHRIDAMTRLADDSGADIDRDDLVRFSQLQHRQVRLDQLSDIQCTSCHTYGAKFGEHSGKSSDAHHFSVNLTSCYTCHFNNEGFNTGTNNCLMCHQHLPAGEIMVHKELTGVSQEKLQSPELEAKSVKMNHQAILDRKVDCASCHADVAIEPAQVSRRDCARCHDTPRFFEGWTEPLTIDKVAMYHKVHVPGQRAKCLDCHAEIHHQLIRDPQAGEASFLTSIMSKCDQCHPRHHREQLELLSGIGSLSVPKGTPNLMFGSRTNCFGCHAEQASDEHGGHVFKATLNGCMACHGDRHAETFEKWKQGLEVMQSDAVDAYQAARKMLDDSKELPDDVRRQATELLAGAAADLKLIQRGNGLHNVTYALEILDSVTQRSEQAKALLANRAGQE